MVIGGAGCTRTRLSLRDAPVSTIDHTPAVVHEMPNQFGNFAEKCDGHGHRVYTTTAKAVTVIDDPTCAK
jgi:hypothetical protein